jgi:hypothetical protein
MANSKNILVGAAAFFVSEDDGTAAQSATLTALGLAGNAGKRAEDVSLARTVATAPVGVTWNTPGYTDGGVEVSYEPTYGDVTVDQLLDSAVVFKSGMKVTVNTTFSEATLENLVVVWGQSEDSLDRDLRDLDIEGGDLGEARPSALWRSLVRVLVPALVSCSAFT